MKKRGGKISKGVLFLKAMHQRTSPRLPCGRLTKLGLDWLNIFHITLNDESVTENEKTIKIKKIFIEQEIDRNVASRT